VRARCAPVTFAAACALTAVHPRAATASTIDASSPTSSPSTPPAMGDVARADMWGERLGTLAVWRLVRNPVAPTVRPRAAVGLNGVRRAPRSL
jgi:hypothetical protein